MTYKHLIVQVCIGHWRRHQLWVTRARASPGACAVRMYTNLTYSVYNVGSVGLLMNATHFPVRATYSQSLRQFSFPVYYIYVEVSVISA